MSSPFCQTDIEGKFIIIRLIPVGKYRAWQAIFIPSPCHNFGCVYSEVSGGLVFANCKTVAFQRRRWGAPSPQRSLCLSIWKSRGLLTKGKVDLLRNMFSKQVTFFPSASAILSAGTRSLSLKFKREVKASSTQCMAERKGQVYADKWAALVQLRWVLEASEHYTGNHGIYGSADRNLERIGRLFGNLLSFAWRWSVDLVASLYFFYSERYLLLQKAKKCRLNQPEWTKRHSAKWYAGCVLQYFDF